MALLKKARLFNSLNKVESLKKAINMVNKYIIQNKMYF